MSKPNFIILYVDSPPASARFYETLLEQAPVEASPTFCMFALPNGTMLGLWSKHTVEPSAPAALGGFELAFAVEGTDKVGELYDSWTRQGLRVAQAPVVLDFGHTFVALDPDGHRL